MLNEGKFWGSPPKDSASKIESFNPETEAGTKLKAKLRSIQKFILRSIK
jgi:hypothetical protein